MKIGRHPDAKPFRFLDLPRELRDYVYDLCLVMPEGEQCSNLPWPPETHVDEAIQHRYRHRIFARNICQGLHSHPMARLLKHPPLLAVSRQIREEADEIYWAKNEWQFTIEVAPLSGSHDSRRDDVRKPMEQLRKWTKMMGMRRLKHLRSFTLRIERMYGPSEYGGVDFTVTFDHTKGLELHSPSFSHSFVSNGQAELYWRLAVSEFRSKNKNWSGEGIINFFLNEQEFGPGWPFLVFNYTYRPAAFGFTRRVRLPLSLQWYARRYT